MVEETAMTIKFASSNEDDSADFDIAQSATNIYDYVN